MRSHRGTSLGCLPRRSVTRIVVAGRGCQQQHDRLWMVKSISSYRNVSPTSSSHIDEPATRYRSLGTSEVDMPIGSYCKKRTDRCTMTVMRRTYMCLASSHRPRREKNITGATVVNTCSTRKSDVGSKFLHQSGCRFSRSMDGEGFGGGKHLPHSDQDSLGIFGDASRRVIKPERIIIVRHGESLGNLDESTYVHVPDWKIPLTKKGFQDGRRAGEKIKEHIGDKPLFIYTSPYLRTKQTLAGMVEAFDTNYIVGVREEPRLTEQQFGNFQNLATIVNSKAERARFGRFYYRFPQGESGLDVYNRATSFIATMFRDFTNESIARDDLNVIIVTHGLTLRLLVMRWFQYSIADFEATLNPANGGFVVMERKEKPSTESKFFNEPNAERRDLRHWYELTPESLAHINFRKQRQFGSLWKLLSELPEEPGVLPDDFTKNNRD